MTDRTLVTRVVGHDFRSDLSSSFPHWKRVTRAASAARAACRDRHAILVVATWLDENAQPRLRSWLRVADERADPIAVTVGYHPKCDVDGIYGACLRHVLIIADPQFRKQVVDVIDLATPHGFSADGANNIRRIQAFRSQRFRVGSADILAVLLEPGDDVDSAIVHMDAPSGARIHRMDDIMQWRHLAEECAVSVAYDVDRVAPYHERSQVMDAVTQVMGMPTRSGCLRVRPSREEIANGFIVGRYERCSVRSQDHMMSRVHALVMGRGDQLLVCDAGSTNGTWLIDGNRTIELNRGARAKLTTTNARLRAGNTDVEIVAA